jgi:RimJ/RimL family protein N-acetyltransferase
VSEPRLTLRPVRADDLDYFDDRPSLADDPYSFFGFAADGAVRKRFAEDGLLTTDSATLLIEVDGGVVGDVSWRSVYFGPPHTSRAIEIGIALRPEHRGRGYGSAAQRVLADYLFANTAINRVQASTDITNIPEQRALTRAGFTREGVLRGAQWRAGEWRDLAMYARLRADR